MRLSFDDVGSGERVVLIHGHPFDRTLWRPQVAALESEFRVPAGGRGAALRGRAERPDYRPGLAGLDIPAFVCAGTADPFSNETVTADIVSSLKRPDLLIIDGVGHLPNLETPEVFNVALSTFLRAHAPA